MAQHIQIPSPLILQKLYCEEEESFEDDNGSEICVETVKKETFLPSVFIENDCFFEQDDELFVLMSKEKQTHHGYIDVNLNKPLVLARKQALGLFFKVKEHYGFNALTMVLAVNYFDRFISSLKLRQDNPWMSQLAAVACLSLAAKVEETQVPLLLDLQVEESNYVFDSKTIQRMELLVLSTLQWRMNPITPISFFNHITNRLGLKSHLHFEFLHSCEHLLLLVITDSRFMLYIPSILAAATMLHVIKDIEPCHYLEYQKQLIGVLKICEVYNYFGVLYHWILIVFRIIPGFVFRQDEVNSCYELISELLESRGHKRKRRLVPSPSSPNGVIDASFSCDNLVDSWAVTTSSVSSSSYPQFKRTRAPDQQMRLPSVNRMFVDLVSRPP
ncbi:cyclin-D3-3 isoform X1 [Gossypium hirsutum]|uniref:Cyclin-D3-3 isoform X1 n=1 Tax=Gossypium hirsutum TaxID=3635 RepID=A0A1U8LZS6_GOSHI|nr:cyclin-D3-3 isoform X1 [Gossypium hirsutum]